jgi:hypothetical protein
MGLGPHGRIYTPAPGCWNPMPCAMRPVHKKTTWSNRCAYWNRGKLNLLISHYIPSKISMLCLGDFKKWRTLKTTIVFRHITFFIDFGLFVKSPWLKPLILPQKTCYFERSKRSQRSATAHLPWPVGHEVSWWRWDALGLTSQHGSSITSIMKPK